MPPLLRLLMENVAFEADFNDLPERHALRVAQFGVGLRSTIAVDAGIGGLIALGQSLQERFGSTRRCA